MKGDEIIKDSVSIGDIVIRILFVKYGTVQQIMTVFGYMVCAVIREVAKLQKHNTEQEMSKFMDYLTRIFTEQKKAENNAEIIKMN